MNAWLALLLESTAIAALVAGIVSVLSWTLLARVGRDVTPAARQADLALIVGVLPMLAAGATLVALVLPSLLHAGGVQADHCALHAHHRHLCALHGGVPGPGLLIAGLVALALGMTRAVRLGWVQVRAHRSITALEHLGHHDDSAAFPQVLVPGSPWLSLAVGVLRPRTLISASLRSHLAPEAYEAVLAHEEAHLRRHDPRWMTVLAWAGLFSAPGIAGLVRASFHEAAEEASDAGAAEAVGPHAVAGALVAVARLHPSRSPALSLGFGDMGIERRVQILLAGQPLADRSLAPRLLLAVVMAVGLVATGGSEWIHHAVESLLQ